MVAYKLTTLIVVSLLVAILLASALNSSLRVADSALADLAPVGVNSHSPQPNAPLVSPSKNYLPLIMLNTPASVSCIYTTNGIAGADAGVCSGNVTLSLTAGGNISNTAHVFGLRIANSGALGGNSAALLATHGAESGMNPSNPSGVWGDSYANWGVLGTSYANVGVEGISNSYFGVRGASVAGSGVYGVNNSSGGITPAAPAGQSLNATPKKRGPREEGPIRGRTLEPKSVDAGASGVQAASFWARARGLRTARFAFRTARFAFGDSLSAASKTFP